jgi:hypothetical protein
VRCAATCERVRADDSDALAAVDVTSPDVVCSVLDLARHPEASEVTLNVEMEEASAHAS